MIFQDVKKLLFDEKINRKEAFYVLLTRVLKLPIYYIRETLNFFVSRRLKVPNKPVVKKLRNNLFFAFDFFFDPRVQNIYREIYEPQTVRILKKYLKKGDTFIDVGANIGYITIIGAGVVGKNGQVHSFEPVPKYYDFLHKSAKLNKDYKIFTNQCAIGHYKGTARLKLTIFNHIGYNTMVEHFVHEKNLKEIIEVKVIRLDEYLLDKNLKKINLIKIDVEGYENFVLEGLDKFFKKEKNLPVILCELMPAYDYENLEKLMIKYNYQAYDLITEKPIDIKKLKGTNDILFKQTLK